MTIYNLDTNVLLRFLVGDNEKQQKQAVLWFKEAERGKKKIVVSSIVIAETCFVLESFYQKNRNEIADALEIFIGQRWLQIKNRDILIGLWPWYRRGFHFVDSLLISWTKITPGKILTFDRRILKSC